MGRIGAWLPVLMLMAAAGLVLAPHAGVRVTRLPLIWLTVAGAAVVIIVLRWLTLPDDGGIGDFGLLGEDTGIESGAGFGLIAAIVSGAAALLVYRASTKATAT